MILYVARHGHTDMNDTGAIRGWINVQLSADGKKEAAALADEFSDKPISVIYAADLDRHLDTANAIAKRKGLPVIPTPLLRPINFGDLQGKPKAEVEDAVGQLYDTWRTEPTVPAPNGESFTDFQNRQQAFIKGVLDTYSDRRQILIVCSFRNTAYLMAYADNNGKPLKGYAIEPMENPKKAVQTGNYMAMAWSPQPTVLGVNLMGNGKYSKRDDAS